MSKRDDPKADAILCITEALRALDFVPLEIAHRIELDDARWSLLTEFEMLSGQPWPDDAPAITDAQREAWFAARAAEQRNRESN